MVNRLRSAGFALIELLVVMAVIATLLTLALPRYLHHLERSKEVVLRENLNVIRDAIDKFYADNGRYPVALTELVERRYLRTMPVDPVTERTDSWLVRGPPAGGVGVYDVHSGAEGLAASGMAFSEL